MTNNRLKQIVPRGWHQQAMLLLCILLLPSDTNYASQGEQVVVMGFGLIEIDVYAAIAGAGMPGLGTDFDDPTKDSSNDKSKSFRA